MLVCAHKGGLLRVLERFSWTMEDPKTTSSFALEICQEKLDSVYQFIQ